MKKQRGSGIYLGTTRRQKNRSFLRTGILILLLLLIILATFFVLSWILDDGKEPEETPLWENVPPVKLSKGDGWTVMLDPGHGYDDAGSSSEFLSSETEATVVTDIACRIRDRLADRGVTVLMTHEDNAVSGRTTVSLGGVMPAEPVKLPTSDRIDYANNAGIDLFLSLHADSLPAGTELSGMRVYYHTNPDAPENLNKAEDCLGILFTQTFPRDGGEAAARALPTESAYPVILDISAPSLLCEVGFVSQQDDAARLCDSAWRDQAAAALADAILAYFGIGA